MTFAPSTVTSRENRNGAVRSGTVFFRKIIKNEVSLMVGVHVNNTIVSGGQDMCDEFLGQLKKRFPVKNPGNSKLILVARSGVTGRT